MITREELIKVLNKKKFTNCISLYKEYKIEIDYHTIEEAKEFHNNYHLDNSVNSKVNIGLYYNDELLSMLSLSKSRYNKGYEYEIIRYIL